MSSFDPPLSRSTAAWLVVGAILVSAWILLAAHLVDQRQAATTSPGTVMR
jgi:hypothetical protein